MLALAGGAASAAALGTTWPTAAPAARPCWACCGRRSIASSSAASRSPTSSTASASPPGPHPIFGNNQTAGDGAGLRQGDRPVADQARDGVRQHGGEHRQGARAVRYRQRQGPHADRRQPGRRPGRSRLQARADRRRRHHARPSRPHRRADDGRQADLSQRALRVRHGGVRLLEEGRRRRRAQGQPRPVHAGGVPFAEKATFLKGEGEVVPGIRAVPASSGTRRACSPSTSRATASAC